MTTFGTWEQQFLAALRVRDIGDPAIGAALAEVEAHCARSGQTPYDAFGSPREYAASLTFPAEAAVSGRPSVATIVLGACAIAGLWVFPDAAGALLRGDDTMDIPQGWLLAGAALALVLAVAKAAIRRAVTQPALAYLMLFGAILSVLMPMVLWSDPALTSAPLIPALVSGALLVGGSLALIWWPEREPDSLVMDPITGRAQGASLTRVTRFAPVLFLAVAGVLTLLAWQNPPR